MNVHSFRAQLRQSRSLTCALAAMLLSSSAFAHPMGNFSISHYAGLHIHTDSIELEYLIDMAEIPTFQEMQQSGMPADPADPRVESYLTTKSAEFAHGLSLTLNGRALPMRPLSHSVIFPQGAGNLPTMKVGFVYATEIAEECRRSQCDLAYADANFPGRAGWKEIVTTVDGPIKLGSGVTLPADRSSRLTDYPTDLVNSPPQDLSVTIRFTVDKPVTASAVETEPPAKASNTVRQLPQVMGESAPPFAQTPFPASPKPIELKANKQSPPRNAFTELMTHKEISFGFALIAAFIAAGLGALHAMEPGHGKTIVAAYLVGSKGTARHALLLGLIVTISHTAGVYLLGAVTLYAQKYIMPDRLYPFLSVISGILIAGMGIYILLKRLMGDDFSHSHVHGPGGHSHGVFWHSHSPEIEHGPVTEMEAARPVEKLGKRQLMILGITGGMVPCPAALVVLLSAVALHRVGFGLFLIVAFSLGLAAVLIGMGLAAVYAGRLLSKVPVEGRLIRLWMPAASAAMITFLGCAIAVRGLMAAGIVEIRI